MSAARYTAGSEPEQGADARLAAEADVPVVGLDDLAGDYAADSSSTGL